jgi:hypothetical protein
MNPTPPSQLAAAGESGIPPRPPRRRVGRLAASLLLGLLVGVLGHYLIYRLSLPSKPFIYVAF